MRIEPIPIKDQSQMTVRFGFFIFVHCVQGNYYDIPISISYVLCLVQICVRVSMLS